MRTIDVTILKGGRTAKEINPLDKPHRSIRAKYMTKDLKESFYQATKEWEEAEKKRKIFEIDFSHMTPFFKALEKKVGGKIKNVHMGYDEGAHHKAKLLHNAKIKIL